MRLATITRSTILLAFVFGMLLASGNLIWRALIAPYLVPPLRPNFSNQGDNLYKDRLTNMPVVKFTSPPKPKRFIPNPSTVKYQGKVNVARGLVLRTEPKQGSNRAGGVEYNASVSILKETPDKEWVYIQVDTTKSKGWVRSGNIFKN